MHRTIVLLRFNLRIVNNATYFQVLEQDKTFWKGPYKIEKTGYKVSARAFPELSHPQVFLQCSEPGMDPTRQERIVCSTDLRWDVDSIVISLYLACMQEVKQRGRL